MEEVWKDISGYEGLYQVSNLGRVKHLAILSKNKDKVVKEEHLCRQTKGKTGYLSVFLCDKGTQKHCLVHRLVAQEFIQNPYNFRCVNHKDENKQNNYVENLEWCTHKYNMNYGSVAKKIGEANSKPIMQLDLNGDIIRRYPSVMQAQRETGFSNGWIGDCLRGRRKTYKGYLWKYDIQGNNL